MRKLGRNQKTKNQRIRFRTSEKSGFMGCAEELPDHCLSPYPYATKQKINKQETNNEEFSWTT